MKTLAGQIRGMKWQSTIVARSIVYSRNGVSGESFYTVLFQDLNEAESVQNVGYDVFMGTVFDSSKYVAVINLSRLNREPFDNNNCWRGDVYEPALRSILKEWSEMSWKEQQTWMEEARKSGITVSGLTI